ncbi:RyR domain-containing protein [Croceicoccus mobilis]|uniref:Ryanodine receptor Ryr domain-containing protein n=1 Tax=Croceicoccus mobilis TaxID=1703339 RepID=A0A917DWD0_9SPHN|nr:RyR domain-containing protein [Croceicoccus mobilis]GGD73971.1 hypothetical protein GCM10010990_24480 [Croceicoccus mobilis]
MANTVIASASIETIAAMAHAANAAYCKSLGDDSQMPWVDAPEWQRESAINGVEFHIANPEAGDAASHENWMKEKLEAGWKYGKVKDVEKKTHPCLVEFDKLPPEQQFKDALFRQIVHGSVHLLLPVEAELAATKRQLTAQKGVATRAKNEAAAIRAELPPTPRSVGPVDKPLKAEELLALIEDADSVMVVLSDGKREIAGVAPFTVEGNAWRRSGERLLLDVPSLQVEGPAAGKGGIARLAGYGLVIDGDLVAYANRPDALPLPPGSRTELKHDVVF